MSVAVVIVTFNRKDLLIETLNSVRKQSTAPDKIYLINNASTDGTHQLLVDRNILEWGNLEYHKLPVNTGGAGGFSHGIQLAVDAKYDWIWTMDDDVVPAHNALEVLLKYTHISECINSRKVFSQTNETQNWEQHFDFATGRLIDLYNASFKSGKDWCPVNVACFEGMLVSRNLVNKISPPDSSYFIYHDDTVFGIKASFHTNVIYVRDAVFQKMIYGYGEITPLRCYYIIRNTIKLRRDVYNTGLVGKPTIFVKFVFLLNLAKTALKCFNARREYAVAKSLVRGWRDGFRNV